MNTSYYFYTSAIVKRYAQETGTDWVQTTVAFETGNVVLIAEIGMVEVAAAFARMQRRGRISEQKQADYLQLFLKDTDEQYRIALLDSHTGFGSPKSNTHVFVPITNRQNRYSDTRSSM